MTPSICGAVLTVLVQQTINREVITWLQSWKSIVFKEKVREEKKKVKVATPFFVQSLPPERQKRRRRQNEEEGPRHRVILLAGPPGLGKTTLAHIAARMCGYRVVEVNAR